VTTICIFEEKKKLVPEEEEKANTVCGREEADEVDDFDEEVEEQQPEDEFDVVAENDERQPQEIKERITTKYMTKYERARLLGTRALQIRYVCLFLARAAAAVSCARR